MNDTMQEADDIEKKYFTISEVAEILKVNSSLIRFWETEFDMIRPNKNKNGERRFTKKDIQDLKVIYHLVKEKGFTLEGAKEYLRNHNYDAKEKIEMIDALEKLKKFLTSIRDNIA